MFKLSLIRSMSSMVSKGKKTGRTPRSVTPQRNCSMELLEDRTLFSDSASAQVTLLHTTGSGANTVYTYDISLKDTGTQDIGTFWFGWQPEEDFLKSVPTGIVSPLGWSPSLTGSGNSTDGSAIEWTASGFYTQTAGQTVDGFQFSSSDSPAVLAGDSPTHPGTPMLTSETYEGAAFSAGAFEFVATAPATTAASTTTLVSSSPTATVGASITLTATVAPASGTGTTPTGTVDFTQDGNDLGSVALNSGGTAALLTAALPVGTDHITATYSGDSAYNASASAALTQVIAPPLNAISTTTTLASSALTAPGGTSVTITATVTPSTPGVVPTGTVNFTLNGAPLGSSPVQSDGTAAFTSTTLAVGTDPIIATYNGDATYAASTSTALTETITTPPSLVPAITKSTVPPSLVSGVVAHGAVTFSVTNETADPIKGLGTVAVYASTTGVIDSTSILLGQVNRQLNVKAGKSVIMSVPAKILAGTLPAGSYTLFARVIDPSSNTNDSAAGPTVLVAAPFIALSETLVKSTIPATAIGDAKVHGAAILKITNNGNITTPGTAMIAIVASLDGIVAGPPIQITSVTKPLHIHAGKTASVNVPVKLIPALAAGPYTLSVQVTDPNGTVTSVAVGGLTITA
jgi:hypothetical protein